MNPQSLFFDSCAVLDLISDSRYTSFLNRLINNKHQIIISITVAGELVQQCIKENNSHDVHRVVDFLKGNDFEIVPADEKVREWCTEVDSRLSDCYGSSTTDRTHLAYALAYGASYYVTSPGEVRSLGGREFFSSEGLKIITIEELKNENSI